MDIKAVVPSAGIIYPSPGSEIKVPKKDGLYFPIKIKGTASDTDGDLDYVDILAVDEWDNQYLPQRREVSGSFSEWEIDSTVRVGPKIYLTVYPTDKKGNYSTYKTTFKLIGDNDLPLIDITAVTDPPCGVIKEGGKLKVYITVSAYDSGSGIKKITCDGYSSATSPLVFMKKISQTTKFTATAEDNAGNIATTSLTVEVRPKKIAYRESINGSYLIDFWYQLISATMPIKEIGQRFGYGEIDPWHQEMIDETTGKQKEWNIRWAQLNYESVIPYVPASIQLSGSGFKPGTYYPWSGVMTRVDAEVEIYGYCDDILWSGKSEVYHDGERLIVNNMPLEIPNFDPEKVFYSIVKIKAVETPGGNVGQMFGIYEMNTKVKLPFPPTVYPLVTNEYTSLSVPSGIDVSSNIVIVERAGKIVKMYKDKKLISEIGAGILQEPVDVKVYTDITTQRQKYFVSDIGRNSVVVFDSRGNYIGEITGFASIGRIEISPMSETQNQKLYVLDIGNKVVKIYDLNSLSKIDELLLGLLEEPKDIDVDEKGNIYVSDNDRVKIFSAEGNLIREIKGRGIEGVDGIISSGGIYVDNQGIIYVTDTSTNTTETRIIFYTNDGKFLGYIPKYYFDAAEDINLDKEGNLFVCDSSGSKVIVYKLNDEVSSVNPLVFEIKFPIDKAMIRLDELVDNELLIRGSVNAQYLLSSKISYGVGTSPTQWIEIYSSTEAVKDDVIYNWDINSLQQGVYSLKIEMDYLCKFGNIEEIKHKEKIVRLVKKNWTEFVDNFEETKDNMFWIDEIPELSSYPWTIKGYWVKTSEEKFDGEYSIGVKGGIETSEIVSPMIDLTGAVSAMLCFWIKYNLVNVGGQYYGHNYCSYVQITDDGGITWKDIEPIGGYPSERPGIWIGRVLKYPPKKSFYGVCPQWTRVRFDLSPYVGKRIKVKIVYEAIKEYPTSDPRMYVYIDDFGIRQTSTDWYKDTVSPGKITGLQAMTEQQIKLVWASPGSDGYSYGIRNGKWEIRYTTNSFLSPDEVENKIVAGFNLSFAGLTTSYVIVGLLPEVTYYFWVRAIDEDGNTGLWSERVSAVSGAYSKQWVFVGSSAMVKEIADIDNDGHKDILYFDGSIYRNEGNFKFTKVWQKTIPESYSTGISAGDFNNDGLIDFVSVASGKGIRVYINKGNYNFELFWRLDTQEDYVAVKVADIDNDGYLDFITIANNQKIKVYKSNKGGSFSLVWSSEESFGYVYSLCCSDYNNDGYVDIVVSVSGKTMLFKNNKDKNFILSWIVNKSYSDIVFYDFDSDGDLDIITDRDIYRNDSYGDETNFSYVTQLRQTSGKVAVGDYDNDGDVDLLISSSVYENAGCGRFNLGFSFDIVSYGYFNVYFIDLDKDKDLDVLINYYSGYNYETVVYKLYFAEGGKSNTQPIMPKGEYKTIYNPTTNQIEFSFPYGEDKETSAQELNYVIRIGSYPGKYNLLSGEYELFKNNPYGFVKTTSTVKFVYCPQDSVVNTHIYWQVRCIDNGFLSSDWSEEQHYYVAVDTQPPIITFVSPVGGERYVVGISSIIINYMVTDNLDVEPKHYAYLTHLEKGTTISVSIGEIIDPVSIDAGFWTLTVVAVDGAGNSISSTTAKFEVIHDILPPRTNVEFRELHYERSNLVYVTKETPFVLSSVDDLVSVNDNKGFGVKSVSYRLDGDWVTVLNPQPQVGQVFVTTFVPVGYNDGLYTFSYFAEDVVGNKEVVKSTSVAIDNTSPKTSIVVYEPKYETSDELPQWYSIRYKTYISPKTFIGFTSEDPVVNGVSCGVRLTKYRIDKTTWVAFIDVYIPEEGVWRSSFTLSEGIREIDYYSIDNLGNEERPFNTAKLFVDGTAPESTLSVEGLFYRNNNLYVGSQTKFKLTCVDPVVKDVSSGVESVYWKTDLDPDFIKKEVPIEDYELPISFPEGVHKIVYQSVDRVKNIEELKELVVYVDITSPQTEIIISEPKFNNFVTSSTFISLLAKDPISNSVCSGVKVTRYRIDNGGWMVYTTEFNLTGLSEGVHTIEYYSEDNVGNTEDIKSLSLIIDNTAPLTTLYVDTPQYSYATNLWVSKYTLFTLTAVDLGEIPSGVSYTEYKIDDGVSQRYVDPFDLSSYSEGEHKIYYRSSDNLSNLEQEKSLSVIIDDSPPETSVTITQPRYNEYVTSASKFVLSSIDSGLIPCGVQYTKYRIVPPSDSLFTVYDSTFNILGPDGVYTIEYYSVDNVGNTEIIKSTTVKLDNTPPISRLELQGVKYISEGKTYIRPDTQIVLLAEDPVVNDVASGVKFILYSIDGAPFDVYSSPFTLEEGVHTIKYYSVDQLGNSELINLITLYVDATPPLSVLVIGEPKCDEQKYPYTVISSKTSLTLVATDPVIKYVSSGVKETKYKVSNITGIISDWDLYKGSFTIVSADGDYLIEYYSIDNVLNTELIKSSTVTLDNTAPFVELLSPIPQSAGFEQLLNGVVEVIGSVKDLHFSWYEVSYAQAGSDEFITIAKEYKEVTKDVLAVWDTTNLVYGYYTLRVTAADCVGNKTVIETEVYVSQAEVVLEFGGIGKEAGKFNSPSYICIDTSSNVWVSDTNNDRIQVFDKNGKFLKEITGYEIKSSGNSQSKGQNKKQYSYFNKPTGISVDKEGNIYIADRNNDRVVKLDSECKFVFELKGFNKPHSLVLDDMGNIYVADRNNNRIQKFSSTGKLLMTITTAVEDSLNKPQGAIVVDSLGRIYVTDRNNDRVLVYSSTGVYLCEISSSSGLNKPDGIYVSKTGFVYVCDSNNDRVVGFNNLFFKMFEIIGFNKPSDVIMDNEGKLWVVDTNNGKIKVYSIPEKRLGTSRLVMSISVLRSPDNFMFGDVYSYPNPAKQTNTTIHIECGTADKIEIKIYNIAGELVHKTTLTGPPKLIRGKLAYEYEWDVKDVSSGVYIYYIYAEKSGEEPIKVLKKLAIIK